MKNSNKTKPTVLTLKGWILFIAVIFFTPNVNAQPCPTGDITFTSDTEIIAFLSTYSNCELTGNVTFEGPGISSIILNNILSVSGDVIIRNNPILGQIALHNLHTIGGYLLILDNPMLEQFSFPQLTASLGMDIYNNPALGQMSLPLITNVPETIYIEDNSFLQIISMPNLATVGGSLRIDGNSSLANLNGLNSLNNLYGLYITDNNSLTSLAALNNLTTVENIIIFGNSALTNLNGLNNLENVDSEMLIVNNNSLTDISALSNLTEVRLIYIEENPLLTTLEGLNNVISSLGLLVIEDNAVLSDITAIENADLSDLQFLYIRNNPVLSYCHLSNICDYLDDPDIVDISGNSGACENVAAVINACALSVSDLDISAFSIYPNPATDRVYIQTGEDIREIRLFSVTGQLLQTRQQQNSIDLSEHNSGIYFIEISTENGTAVKRVVKK